MSQLFCEPSKTFYGLHVADRYLSTSRMITRAKSGWFKSHDKNLAEKTSVRSGPPLYGHSLNFSTPSMNNGPLNPREGLGSNPGEDMDVCKRLVPLRHGGTLNSRQAATRVKGEERWEVPGHPQGFLPLNWGGTKPNRIVTCMVLKAKANDRCKKILALSRDELRGPRFDFVRQSRHSEIMARRKGLTPDEIAYLLRELSENESVLI
ncbi:cullin-4A [Trichonephila clavipes]|nr:cullin-4A [Trichonephila clavipes]